MNVCTMTDDHNYHNYDRSRILAAASAHRTPVHVDPLNHAWRAHAQARYTVNY